MSPIALGGPALFIGDDGTYVALERPKLDPADPGVVEAAAGAGVTPEEFAGDGDVWSVLYEDGASGEGGGFELPGLRDAEAEDFAERLAMVLRSGEAYEVEAGDVLVLDARPAGEAWTFTARLTPPEGQEGEACALELGPLATAALLAGLDDFRGSLA
ncbi:hypothetical protein ABT160_17835 [Streptomyces sp. NPDC001941]|uniref:hypothetical protein n=1 Tax=Streptomyces sp. NPDC001941 TaxID=3154659 RepID=UPI0033318616